MISRRKLSHLLVGAFFLALILFTGSPVAQAGPNDVVINEIMQNPSATADGAGEWFELYNAGATDVDINGWTIADNDFDSHVIANSGPLLVPAGGYLVLGNNADLGTNGGVSVAYDYGTDMFLANGADEVVLFDGALAEIDRVEYDGGPLFPDPNGASMALVDPALNNNVGANWCEASTAYGAGDFGTPGAANDCPSVAPEIIINEIMQNPAAVADGAGEWFELYNAGATAVDINGWTVADNDTDSFIITNGGPLLVPAGGYLVLGNNADSGTNGGVTVDYQFSGMAIANGADEIVLFDGALAEIDRVEYDGGPLFPDPNGASMALADPALDNNVGANWCEASTAFGAGDFGTPGAENDCVLTTPDIIINEIMQNPAAVADGAGEWFELYNAGATDVDINGWTIADNDFDSHVINNGGPLLVPAGGYLVLGNNADPGTNGGVTVAYQFSGMAIANGADEIVLFDGALTEIDRVEYDGGPLFPDPNGASMALVDPALDNNVGSNWCEASTPYGAGDFGTPGTANDCPIVTPDIVINEIMQNPAAVADGAGEWFELYNAGATAVDINGWTVADNDTDSFVITNGEPLLVLAGGYLVLGNNADSGTNGGVSVAYAYGTSMFLANGADEVVLFDGALAEIDRVEYDGGSLFPDPNGASMSLSDPALDNNVGANWCESVTEFGSGDKGTPGAENVCQIPEPPLSCDDASVITLIHDVQGAGATSPMAGSNVVIDGVVVGDFQNNASADSGELNGFYVQEEDAEADSDPLTSEGIFVFAPGADDVSSGDHVRVRGDVSEFSTSGGASLMTELTNVTVALCSTPAAMPSATIVTMPVTNVSDFERYEGMLVTFPQGLSISEYFNFDRFNEVVLTLGRHYQPTAVEEPGSAEAITRADQNARSRITLDDGRTNQNPDPAIHPNGGVFDLSNLFRGGDTVQNTTGIIDDTFGLYRIQPTQAPSYSAENPRETTPADVGGSLTVASFNVLNYFTTLDTGAAICGPLGTLDCRGADNADEFTRQRTKIIAALADIDADIVGLIELENHATDAALIDLVDSLNGLVGAGTYSYIATGPIGADAIKVGLIYKSANVTPKGGYAILDSSVDSRFIDTKSRPVLAQTFVENDSGGMVTVAVNHLKSKGSACDDVGDPIDPNGQGNCNLTRVSAAQALVDWLAADPTSSGDADFLIVGDLNSYDKEDPIDVVLAGADDMAGTGDDYTDLIAAFSGELAYSYVFDGQLGYLDYGISSQDLTRQVTGITEWHINADEPDILDYNTDFKAAAQIALYEENAFRSSDHDPLIIGLNLDATPVVTVVPAAQSVQYSDPIATVSISAADTAADFPLSISTEWKVDSGSFTSGLPGWLALNDSGCDSATCEWTLSGTAAAAPGSYVVRVTIDDNRSGATTADITISVTPEDARVAYTGALYVSTASESSDEAIVTLAATVQDISVTADAGGDSYPGDIRNATVSFVDLDSNTVIAGCADLPLSLVDPGDLQTATVTCHWPVTLSGDAQDFTIGIVVNGFYTRNSAADNVVVIVAKPLGSEFISGGGFIVLAGSAGQIAGDDGSKSNFGLNVKYNNGGKKLQGRVNVIVRRSEADGLHVYQIKSNSMSSLAVQPENGTATFYGKANIQDITDPLNPVSVDGNATLLVTMTDNGQPGSADSIGVTLWSKSGGLWYSSQWDGVMTTEQLLAGGNLVVH